MTSHPLVTVVCLCYNQARWIGEAVRSVHEQTYPSIQLIIVDDASTDDSVKRIKSLTAEHPATDVILLNENVGNCKAFNTALPFAKGKYIIDFAADDVMMPDRIEKQVNLLELLPGTGVVFTDADYIDQDGKFIRTHFGYLRDKGLLTHIPQGDVFKHVLSTYFIPSPTMMIRKEIFDELGGYDEDLAYEDFDFWVRSSRKHHYVYLPEKLTRIRKSEKSMSAGWYRPGDRQLHSTFLVCRKAVSLCRDSAEREALIQRVRYELKQAAFSDNFEEARLFHDLLIQITTENILDVVMFQIARIRFPLSWMRNIYYRWRYGRRNFNSSKA